MQRKPPSLLPLSSPTAGEEKYSNDKDRGRPLSVAVIAVCVVAGILITALAYSFLLLDAQQTGDESAPQGDDAPEANAGPAAAAGVDIHTSGVDPVRAPSVPSARVPLVLLYDVPGGSQTALWAGYGDASPLLTTQEAVGVTLHKADVQCAAQCTFTRDQTMLPQASAVLVEWTSLSPKQRSSAPPPNVVWPVRNSSTGLPLLGNFFYEHAQALPEYISEPALVDHTDFAVGSDPRFASILVNKICLWGMDKSVLFEQPSMVKLQAQGMFADNRLLVYYGKSENAKYSAYLTKLARTMSMHIFDVGSNIQYPPRFDGEYSFKNRVRHMSEYLFMLVLEPVTEEHWVSPEWTMAFLAGVVPVYFGAPNIAEYAPGPNSYLDGRDFPQPEMLAGHLKMVYRSPGLYKSYHAWRTSGQLSPGFESALGQCVYDAECRVCEGVHKKLAVLAAHPPSAAVEPEVPVM